MMTGRAHTIHLISDGTCRTCERVVRSVLIQFEDIDVALVWKTNVLRAETVWNAIKDAADAGAIVFYTLVAEETRAAIREAAQQHMVPVVDILGPVLVSMCDLFNSPPSAKPGVFHEAHKEQFDRIDAVEYTLNHDDGRAIEELSEADVVLVGVSRACKSTTCFYLAYRGIRAANVPLFPDTDPPPELLNLDTKRVIGLTVNPHRLRSVREARLRRWGMDPLDEYADKREIGRELRLTNEQMAKHGWRIIDVSYKAIEEVALEVRQSLKEAGIAVGERESPTQPDG
ncbi:MAG: kinase/pyrophosphorylase [Phycisphaerae bacterium]|nr:kinase/pyrophosphorylase [Phycisphaerae bacterium]